MLTKAGWAVVIGGGAAVALLVFLFLTLGRQAYLDHQAVRIYDRILGYNLQRGHLELPPELAPGVQAPPAPKP